MKRQKQLFWRLFAALLFLNLLIACAAPDKFVDTGQSSSHTWNAGPVLVEFMNLPTARGPYGVREVPDLILYSDGRLIRYKETSLQESRLTRQEMCTLLNTIDQSGFFEFDLVAYENELKKVPLLGEIPATQIVVNAWRSKQEIIPAVSFAINNPHINTPDSLRRIYQLFSNYQPAQVESYKSSQLAFTIYRFPTDSPYKAEHSWSLNSPALAELYAQASIRNGKGLALLLEGETASRVDAELGKAKMGIFSENGANYFLSARPLLPYESIDSAVGIFEIPSPGVITATTTLTCSMADGMLSLSK